MTNRPRLRKCVKWTALGMAVLLLTTFVASNSYSAFYNFNHFRGMSIARGCIYIYSYDPVIVNNVERFSLNLHETPVPFIWFFEYRSRLSRSSGGATNTVRSAYIPLWAPFLAACGIGHIAWKLDAAAARRARGSYCAKCGYHRAGLKPDALCPECGAVA